LVRSHDAKPWKLVEMKRAWGAVSSVPFLSQEFIGFSRVLSCRAEGGHALTPLLSRGAAVRRRRRQGKMIGFLHFYYLIQIL